ncbi:hypothetical protein Ate01nite_35780 [Actinoplanes teichomyceticus]|nr:hypothetical protein Ate01nite_35780 [Actinoplanes teichomyceticus]
MPVPGGCAEWMCVPGKGFWVVVGWSCRGRVTGGGWMRRVRCYVSGGPSVVRVADVVEPVAGDGESAVRARAVVEARESCGKVVSVS